MGNFNSLLAPRDNLFRQKMTPGDKGPLQITLPNATELSLLSGPGTRPKISLNTSGKQITPCILSGHCGRKREIGCEKNLQDTELRAWTSRTLRKPRRNCEYTRIETKPAEPGESMDAVRSGRSPLCLHYSVSALKRDEPQTMEKQERTEFKDRRVE